MGLLDSNKVGQLTKNITLEATLSSSNYVGEAFNIAGYNLVSFRVQVLEGSLDGSTSYLSLNAQNSQSNLQSVDVYERASNNSYGEPGKKFAAGHFVSEDMSAFTFARFYITTSASVKVRIEYTLINGTFQDKVNGWKLNSLIADVSAIKEDAVLPREQLLKTFTNLDLSSTGANTFTLPNVNKAYNALRINIVFNQSDDNAVLYVAHTKGSNTTATGWQRDIVTREDGIFREFITPIEGLRYDYYLKGIPTILNIRKEVAGASGLTATINIFATTCEAIPEPLHIQPVFSKTYVTADSGQNIVFNFNTLMKAFKFWFCQVGTSADNKTGTIVKNYATNDEDDSETILSFTSKPIAVSKWIPVTVTNGAKVTFNVTGARNNTDKLEIYGVV